MLSNNAQTILKILAAANGQTIKADDLRAKSGLSDVNLEAAASELEGLGYATLARGGEQIGQSVRFYFAFR